MLLVVGVFFSCNFFPTAIVREEGIGLLRNIIYFGQKKPVGKGDSLAIDPFPTYYIYVIVILAGCESLFERVEALASGQRLNGTA